MAIPEAKPFADFIMKIVNTCISKGSLRHRKFRNFLEEAHAEFPDLSKMQQVRWLSCSKVFAQFFGIHKEIDQFLRSCSPSIIFEQFSDIEWLQKLAFFTDLSQKLAVLNLNLQGNLI